LSNELDELVCAKLSGTGLNLLQLTGAYTKLLENFFTDKAKIIAGLELEGLSRIAVESEETFSTLVRDFMREVSSNAEKILGVPMPAESFPQTIGTISKPDIKISKAFDTALEIIWFMIPMFIFRNPMISHFRKQIPFETEKTLSRLSAQFEEIITKRISVAENTAIARSEEFLKTLENLLAPRENKSEDIAATITRMSMKSTWINS